MSGKALLLCTVTHPVTEAVTSWFPDKSMSQSSASSSSKSAEEDVSASSSEALEEVNGHIKEVFEILKRETMKVRKEMEAFDSVAKKLKHVHFSKTLKLIVGGQLFSTSLETMKKDPGNIFY